MIVTTAIPQSITYYIGLCHLPWCPGAQQVEMSGLSHSDGKHPDGVAIVSWKCGKSPIWDAIGHDTLFSPIVLMPPWTQVL